MAKKDIIIVKMENKETGEYFMAKKNPKTQTEKMKKKRYSRKLRKHVEFKENPRLK